MRSSKLPAFFGAGPNHETTNKMPRDPVKFAKAVGEHNGLSQGGVQVFISVCCIYMACHG